jgi:predicted transcriptional regulator
MDHPVPDRPESELKHAFDISEETFAEAVRIGIEAADRGDSVPHAEVREWLLALARGERRPPPTKA